MRNIKKNENKLKTLEDIIHLEIRKKMNIFLKIKNKIFVLNMGKPINIDRMVNKEKISIEQKENKVKKPHLGHFKKNKFEILNKRQISPIKKKFLCNL